MSRRLIRLDEVDSTNAWLKREGWPPATAVLAARQTAGYGQRGRSWVSPPDAGMYLSTVVELPAVPTLLPLLAGLAVRDGLAPYTTEVGLKWVNDVVARGCKLGGILVEAGRGRAIVGIGVNLRTPPVEGAIGLDVLTTAPPDAAALAVGVLDALDGRLAQPPAATLADWRAASVVLGRHVVVEGQPGLAEDVGPAGELLLRTPDGELRAMLSGTLRMADGAYV